MAKRKTQAAAALPATSTPESVEPQEAAAAPASPPAEPKPRNNRPSELTDSLAGTTLYWDYDKERAEIKFKQNPGSKVTGFMHTQHFKFDQELELWHMPIRTGHWQEDRLAARRTFHKASQMVRAEKGITEDGPGLPG
jgi:hypothetical protein